MATLLRDVETKARQRLIELTPKFWTSAELLGLINDGIKDLWRDIVDLKQEHFLKFDDDNVTQPSSSDILLGVPTDVHKIYLIEPRVTTLNSGNSGLRYRPLDYNHKLFVAARTMDPIDPANAVVYYSISGAGGPDNQTVVKVAPQVSTTVDLLFVYVPTLPDFNADDQVPIPGEATNALVAWTVAYARGKENDTRAPDAGWLTIYATEKEHLKESLGVRQYQEPLVTDALFEEYWG